jgi:adenylate kinase
MKKRFRYQKCCLNGLCYPFQRIFVLNKKMIMQHLILFGPPGSGKGTQAAKLLEKYNLIHISTGDLFRYEMKHNTELGTLAKSYMSQGKLVPDAVTIGMLKNKVEKHPDANGFIYDGFPRTVAQAEALDAYLAESEQKISGLVAMQVDDEEIVKRIMLRGATSGRADDNDESIIRNRIEVYNAETYPVFEHYKEFERAHWVDGLGTIDEIFDRLCNTIDRIF